MPRIHLRISTKPPRADVFLNIKLKNSSGYDKRAALVDTGAPISLLPDFLMNVVEYRLTSDKKIIIERAGMTTQEFEAVEAIIPVMLEDQFGAQTGEFECKVWFANTT